MFFYSNKEPSTLLLRELIQGNITFCSALETSSLLLARSMAEPSQNQEPSLTFSMYSLSQNLDSMGHLLFNKCESELLFQRCSDSNTSIETFVKKFMYSFNS